MQVFLDTLMEKHAYSLQALRTGASNLWSTVPGVKKYRAAAADPVFKAKAMAGKAALATIPVAAGAYWLDKPEPRPGPNPNMLGQTPSNTM